MKKYLIILILTFIILDKINAQVNANNWTWIKGSNVIDQPGYYGFNGIPNVFTSPGGRQAHVASSTISGKLLLMGGFGKDYAGNDGKQNDLWQFDPATNNWTWLKGNIYNGQSGTYGVKGTAAALNTPGARNYSSSWIFNNKFYVWGGTGYDNTVNTGLLNDLWQYDLATNNWTWLRGSSTINHFGVYGTQGVAHILNEPGSRESATSWKTSVLYLMGGYGRGSIGTGGGLNDLWKYDPSTNNWTWLKGSNIINQSGVYGVQGVPNANNIPGSRTGAMSWELNGLLYLMGGNSYDPSLSGGVTNDLWKYDPTTNNWTWLKGSNVSDPVGSYGTKGIASPSNTPGSRNNSATWVFNGRLYLMGGYSGGVNGNLLFNDLWEYDPITNNWTWLKGSNLPNQAGTYGTIGASTASNTPGARVRGGSAYLYNFKLYLMGGLGFDNTNIEGNLNDLWEYVPCQKMVSIAAGNWNDPNTWSCGKVPSYNDPVTVGHILSVSGTGFCKNITYTLGGKIDVSAGGILKVNMP
jgi:N-acetylneuraminic acid mutarotase